MLPRVTSTIYWVVCDYPEMIDWVECFCQITTELKGEINLHHDGDHSEWALDKWDCIPCPRQIPAETQPLPFPILVTLVQRHDLLCLPLLLIQHALLKQSLLNVQVNRKKLVVHGNDELVLGAGRSKLRQL